MKLLIVLMLTALPLYCYAGSGCQLLEFLVDKAFDPEVSVSEFQEYLQEFIDGDNSAQAAAELKQCFLNQSNKTLHNFGVIMTRKFPGGGAPRSSARLFRPVPLLCPARLLCRCPRAAVLRTKYTGPVRFWLAIGATGSRPYAGSKRGLSREPGQ
ncbi:mammaglobin-B-like [Sapajus apella]|uniref:Mammaglobin-B-like n=1 Tax=Sapajus apella TaxID=9515 RepID=A0A6J3I8R8_SAPAP|nr:mammaglobin-B-like [Sapajus apella]